MREYELVTILSPELTSTKRSKLISKIKKMIVDLKGKVVDQQEWGMRELAYPINKMNKGFYTFWQLELEGAVVAQIDEKLKLENEIIRYLLVRVEGSPKSVQKKKKNTKGGEKKKS